MVPPSALAPEAAHHGAHDLTDGRRPRKAFVGHQLLNGGAELVLACLGRQIDLQEGSFPVFFLRHLRAISLAELLGGILALLDGFLDEGDEPVFADFVAAPDGFVLELRQEHPQSSEAFFVPGLHGGFEIVLNSSLWVWVCIRHGPDYKRVRPPADQW